MRPCVCPPRVEFVSLSPVLCGLLLPMPDSQADVGLRTLTCVGEPVQNNYSPVYESLTHVVGDLIT